MRRREFITLLGVSDAEFDAIFERIKKAGLSYGSAPWSLNDANSTIGTVAVAFISRIRTVTCLS
jgi:hypothetical protein